MRRMPSMLDRLINGRREEEGTQYGRGLAAFVLPGVGTTSENGSLDKIRAVLRQYGVEPVLVSPNGPNHPWKAEDTGEIDFRVLEGNLVRHLNLRPNAQQFLFVPYSGSGMIVTHSLCVPRVIPPDKQVFVAGFAAKFDDSPVVLDDGRTVEFLHFKGDPQRFCARVTDIVSIWGTKDTEIDKDMTHLPCMTDEQCYEVPHCGHLTIWRNEEALTAFERFLQRIGLSTTTPAEPLLSLDQPIG